MVAEVREGKNIVVDIGHREFGDPDIALALEFRITPKAAEAARGLERVVAFDFFEVAQRDCGARTN